MQFQQLNALTRVAILLVLFGLSSAVWQYSTGNLTLTQKQISTFSLFTFPSNVPGKVALSINTPYNLEICFQADLAPVNFASCDPNLHFHLATNGTNNTVLLSRFDDDISYNFRDDFFNPKKIQNYIELLSKPAAWQYYQRTIYFLPGQKYYLVAAWETSENSSFSIDFTALYESCGTGVPSPDGICYNPSIVDNNSTTTTTLTRDQVVYFSIDIPAPQNPNTYVGSLNFSATVLPSVPSNSTYNLTFYVQRDALPGQQIYSAWFSVAGNKTSAFVIPTPLSGAYYLMTNNTNSAQAQISVNAVYNTGCNATNSSQTDCPVQSVKSPAPGETAAQTGPNYFSFTTSHLRFGVGTKDKTNAPPIYLSTDEAGWPSQYSYIAKSTKPDVNFFDFVADPTDSVQRYDVAESNVTRTWKIFVNANSSQDYYVWVGTYCPYNCAGTKNDTSLGQCDQTTGRCNCKKGNTLFCSKSGLGVGWIILIIVLVILVVLCAIGIPLALYIRQKRSGPYERV